MTKNLPPLTWFRAFEAAARTLSFTAAADEIGLTQSAVSQQIKSLETRLRTPLFHRQARGLRLTDAGRNLLPDVEAALAQLEQATARYRGIERQRHLTVVASISVLEWVISPSLPAFHDDHPEISVSFASMVWPDEFQRPAADVEVRFGSQKQVGKGAVFLPNGLVAVRAPGRVDLPVIATVGTSVGWETWSEATGVKVDTPRVMADSYGLATRLAVDGVGMALVNRAIAARGLAMGWLELASEVEIPGTEGYFLYSASDSRQAKAFSDWVQAKMEAG